MPADKARPPRVDLVERLLLIGLWSAVLWIVVSLVFFAFGSCIEFTSPWCAPAAGIDPPSAIGLGRAAMLLLGAASVSLSAGTAIAWAIMTFGSRSRLD